MLETTMLRRCCPARTRSRRRREREPKLPSNPHASECTQDDCFDLHFTLLYLDEIRLHGPRIKKLPPTKANDILIFLQEVNSGHIYPKTALEGTDDYVVDMSRRAIRFDSLKGAQQMFDQLWRGWSVSTFLVIVATANPSLDGESPPSCPYQHCL